MAAVGITPSGTVVAEDIRNLQSCTGHERRALLRRLVLLALLGELIEWAHHLGDHLGGDPRVMRRRIEPLVAEQRLDHADVELAFQQMGRKAVPQGVKRRAGLDLGGLGGEMKDAVELARRQRVDCRTAGEQPALRSRRLPPLPQHIEQIRRQHHVAILAALPLVDADHHLGAVDVADLERHHLGGAQAAAVGKAQQQPVLEAGSGVEQAPDLLGAEHERDLLRLGTYWI